MLAAALLVQVAVTASAQTLITVTNTTWRYLADATDQGTAWTAPAFVDSAWLTGRGLFGNDTTVAGYTAVGGFATVINGTGSTPPGPQTAYYRVHFNWSGTTAGVIFTTTNYIDDAFVMYLNGTEILRYNIDVNPVVFASPAVAANPGGEGVAVVRSINMGTNLPANPLVAGDNVLAVEVHQTAGASSDHVFGMSLNASQQVAPCTDTIQPTNRIVTVGRSTTFVVVQPAGCGIPAPTLQWYRNVGFGDELITGQTGASLTVTNAQTGDAGQYFVRLTGSIAVDSRRAVLTVNPDGQAPQFLRFEIGSGLSAFRLVVDEPLCIDAGACGSDATFQFNWQLVNIANPGDDLGVATVVITGNNVDFTTSVARTPGQKYKIVVDAGGSGIADLSGNFVTLGTSITNLDQANFKQGFNGYTGVEDTELEAGDANGGPDAVHGTTAFILVDKANGTVQLESQALVRFNNIFGNGVGQVPLGSDIISAVIRMQHTQANANGNPVNLHRMLVPWSQTVATWNNMNANGTPGIQPDGVEAVATSDYRFDSGALTVPFGLDLDVTVSVQAWSGGQANNGWAFIDRKSTRLNSSHVVTSRMPSSA